MSSPREAIPGSEAYSFCESVTASGRSRWHLRKLDEGGRAFGGGIGTPSLCGFVQPRKGGGFGGWDVNAVIAPCAEEYTCATCWEKFHAELRPPAAKADG